MKSELEFRRYSGDVYLPLYKYYSNLNYAKDAIENQRIHLELSSDYNDIYDSAFIMTPETLKHCVNTSKNICNMLRAYLPYNYQSAVDACVQEINSECFSLYDFIMFACKYDVSINPQILTEHCVSFAGGGNLLHDGSNRISCFSERNDSILMWSYYANKHTGVCLEFDIASDSCLRHYCSKINYSHFFTGNEPSFDGYYIKSDEWSHEQEWRIVCYTDSEYIPTQSLRSIILGARIPGDQREDMMKLGLKYHFQVYQVQPCTKEFKLNIVPVTSTEE